MSTKWKQPKTAGQLTIIDGAGDWCTIETQDGELKLYSRNVTVDGSSSANWVGIDVEDIDTVIQYLQAAKEELLGQP